LQYLFQARDADEHGIEEVVDMAGGGWAVGVFGPAFGSDISTRYAVNNISISGDQLATNVTPLDGKRALPAVRLAHYTALAPVTGRGDIVYQPPKEHLGKPIEKHHPVDIGRLGLAYQERIIEEAAYRADA